MSELWPWLALFGLGAFHGVNPAMGWLFAVALGLQEKSRRAVLSAIPPIALGHALSVAIVVAVVWVAQANLPEKGLRYGTAAILFGFGLFRLLRARHPKWVGMRVGFGDLTLWSFLMTSAHGAGLMLVPILVGWPHDHTGHSHGMIPSSEMPVLSGPLQKVAAVAVHSAGHLSVSLLIALVVYEKFGLSLLRRAWFNLDLLWMIALMICGLLVLII
jgi:hypothetical protein